jgi:hypothetical protein
VRAILFFLLLGLFCAAWCQAAVSAVVSLSNGVQVSLATATDNGTPVKLNADLEPASGDSFYRIFRDENNLTVFAYELEVTRTSDGNDFRMIAKPATEAFAARFPNSDGGKPTPTLSAALESPVLHPGERFHIPIPTAPQLGQTLTDTVRVVLHQPGMENNATPGSARIQFDSLKVFIHGQLASPAGRGADVAGRYAMFYLPGHGGYFFSANSSEPAPFANIVVVNGNQLTFNIDNEMYDCTANAPILLRSERGQLWLYYDPNYKPSGNWTKTDLSDSHEQFFTAASDSLRWWMP